MQTNHKSRADISIRHGSCKSLYKDKMIHVYFTGLTAINSRIINIIPKNKKVFCKEKIIHQEIRHEGAD